mgnify:CR=1 FL=1
MLKESMASNLFWLWIFFLYDNFIFVDENFGGTLPLELLIYADEEQDIYDREFLERVDSFEREIELMPDISKSISICDHLKAVMKNQYPDSWSVLGSVADSQFHR